ncbi:Bug family tripartite tricarboxylate transporter substrate binding protein [Ramlibacter sp.]|uniref:Bug family tripartite tricarboxylate transporter substrate binding protein n=1 Tax=Ramlibacter sp. TaxID=1917967 RepID=UPI003D09BBE7
MQFRAQFKRIAAFSLMFAAAAASHAQTAATFPTKPIHIVVPFAAGTTTDQAARYVGQKMSEQYKQPVIVENKAGANGFIALQYLLQQPADGHYITFGTNTTHAANTALFKKVPYEPVNDFVPLSGVIIGGVVLVVAPSTPANNVQEFIALAKKKGRLTFGSGNSSSRAGGEVMRDLANIELVNVSYKALPAAITDVIGGQIDAVFGDAPAVMPLVRAGKLKALGVSTRARMPGYEDIPTIAEQGVSGYETNGWIAAFAPKGTPADVADKLGKTIADIMRTPDAAKYFGANAWKPIPMSRSELAAFQKTEIARWARLVEKAGIVPE